MIEIISPRTLELEADVKVGFSDRLELIVGDRRIRAHNIIVDSALSGLRTRLVSDYLGYLGLVRKINGGWAPAAADVESSYCGNHYTINCGDPLPGVPDPVDMQDSWLETWTGNRYPADSYAWAPDYSYVEITRHWLFGTQGQQPGWDPTKCITYGAESGWGRGGTNIALGGSNETGLGECFKSGHLNGGCLSNEPGHRKVNGLVICSTASMQNPPYDAGLGYQPAPFHQLTYLWSVARFEDGGGSPIFIELDPSAGGYEQLHLVYTLRLPMPSPVEQTVGGYSIRTIPRAGPSWSTEGGAWDPFRFPNIGGGAAVQESNAAPGFLDGILGDAPGPNSASLVGTGDYYREWTYRWDPAYANYASGIGRVFHGAWDHPNIAGSSSAFCTLLLDKAMKTYRHKFVLNARYSWARV